jgi:hypothetical protein
MQELPKPENEKKELPPKYYLDYFEYVLTFVKEKYGTLLNTEEWRFLRKYHCLTEDARCLFIRFSNRRGLFFRTGKIKYAEIEDIPKCLAELLEQEFISELSPEKHQSVAPDLLQIFTKPELLKLFKDKELKKLNKADLVETIINEFNFDDVTNAINNNFSDIIKVNFERDAAFMKFLFFGNRYLDMTEFVVRDLGLINYYRHNDDELVARFTDRKDAEDKWLISDQYELFKQLKEVAEPKEVFDWFITLNDSLEDLSEVALPSYERLILRIGRYLEREKHYDESLEVYQLTSAVPSRERQVRTLEKLKNIEGATALCEEMIASSFNADEHFFATDFIARLRAKKRHRKSTTEELKAAELITVSFEYKKQVELGSINYFIEEKGYEATFSENHLWRGMFGLIFWDIVFDPSLVAFHHPFQRRPSDLHLPAFYEKRKTQIIEHLDSFDSIEKLLIEMGNRYEKYQGIANPFVIWVKEIWTMIRKAVEYIGLESCKEVMHEMARNIVENSRGFPDIFVWDPKGNHYEFIEIKSPTDNLSNQQLYWLRYFKEIGVNARVLRVDFEKPTNEEEPTEILTPQ